MTLALTNRSVLTPALVFLFVLGLSLSLIPTQAHAAGLTEQQIQAVIQLLRAFDADESVVESTEAALRDEPLVFNAPAEHRPQVVLAAEYKAAPELPPTEQSVPQAPPVSPPALVKESGQVAAVPAAAYVSPEGVAPDYAGFLAAAAMFPFETMVDSLSEILFMTGLY